MLSGTEILILSGLATVVMSILWRMAHAQPKDQSKPATSPELTPDDLREARDNVELALYLPDEASKRLRHEAQSHSR